jgi:hypothetical protein
MKYLLSLLIFTSSFGILRAQDDTASFEDLAIDTTAVEESTDDYDSYDDNDTDNNIDTSEQAEESESSPLVDPATLTEDYKNKPVSVRKFDQTKWKKVVGETNYNESELIREEPTKQTQAAPWAGAALKLAAYIVIIAIVIALLYAVLKNTRLERKLKKTSLEHDRVSAVENIEELDIPAMIRQALAQGNYRLAVRLYYLDILKKLNEGGFIIWKKDKTNREYLQELFTRDYYFDDVRKLTLAYEQVWYGEYTLTPEVYQQLIARFETVQQKLNTSA